ncbi:MAG: hypothetical protein HC898_05905 [Phycisphaerales bacterium]|nr:hypothetical protein [Phycisphaerales bacterium]
MSNPLVMLGPGGDFQVRYEVHGQSLLRQVGGRHATSGEDESAGGQAGYLRMPRKAAIQSPQPIVFGQSGGNARQNDSYQHTVPQATGTYAPAQRVSSKVRHQRVTGNGVRAGLPQVAVLPITMPIPAELVQRISLLHIRISR